MAKKASDKFKESLENKEDYVSSKDVEPENDNELDQIRNELVTQDENEPPSKEEETEKQENPNVVKASNVEAAPQREGMAVFLGSFRRRVKQNKPVSQRIIFTKFSKIKNQKIIARPHSNRIGNENSISNGR